MRRLQGLKRKRDEGEEEEERGEGGWEGYVLTERPEREESIWEEAGWEEEEEEDLL